MKSRPRPSRRAWAAYVISSALIVATLAPVVRYGTIIFLFPVFMVDGCDGARSCADCQRILMAPLIPIALTLMSLVGCRSALRHHRYLGSVLGAGLACGASWLSVRYGFG